MDAVLSDPVLSDPVLSDPVLRGSVPRDAVPSRAALRDAAPPSSPVMDLLSHHLPLTLLLDLALGVRSDEVYLAEPGDLSWLPHQVA